MKIVDAAIIESFFRKHVETSVFKIRISGNRFEHFIHFTEPLIPMVECELFLSCFVIEFLPICRAKSERVYSRSGLVFRLFFITESVIYVMVPLFVICKQVFQPVELVLLLS